MDRCSTDSRENRFIELVKILRKLSVREFSEHVVCDSDQRRAADSTSVALIPTQENLLEATARKTQFMRNAFGKDVLGNMSYHKIDGGVERFSLLLQFTLTQATKIIELLHQK